MAEAAAGAPERGIPVKVKGGPDWRSPQPTLTLCQMVYGLARSEFRNVAASVIRKLLSRQALRNREGSSRSTDRQVNQLMALRRGTKGLAMEMTMSALLTRMDHPREVLMNGRADEEAECPDGFAGPYLADIVVTPPTGQGREFRIVCEVSANKVMDDKEYRKQLVSGLDHAKRFRKTEGLDTEVIIYVLVANLKKIGRDTVLQAIYRSFVKSNEKDLKLMGPIRFVLMRASDMATAMKILNSPYEEPLEFESHHLAEVFDVLHEIMMGDNIPTDTDWMAQKMVEIIRGGVQRDRDLLAAAAPEHPAPIRR